MLFAMSVSTLHTVSAQDYPNRPLRVVTSEVGAGGDFTARLVAQGLTAALGQSAVVDNRAGGVIAGEFVARAAPDGYTLLVYGNTLWLLPLMRKEMPYDTWRDFAPVILATRNSNVLVVHPSLPVRNMTELVRFARARPGQLNYGSAAAGTTSHVGAELLKYVAKLDIVRVPFRGATSALNSLLSGQVHLLFMGGSSAVSQIQAGRLRALAVASPEPSLIFPGVLTMAAAGLPGVEVFSIFGVFVPARTPSAIIALINQEIARALQTPEVKARLKTVGSEAVGGPPEALSAAMHAEFNRIETLSRSVSLRDE